jgi:hypothetical protein
MAHSVSSRRLDAYLERAVAFRLMLALMDFQGVMLVLG